MSTDYLNISIAGVDYDREHPVYEHWDVYDTVEYTPEQYFDSDQQVIDAIHNIEDDEEYSHIEIIQFEIYYNMESEDDIPYEEPNDVFCYTRTREETDFDGSKILCFEPETTHLIGGI